MTTLLIAVFTLLAFPLYAQQTEQGPDLQSSPASLTATYESGSGTVLSSAANVSGRSVDFGIGFSAGGSGTYEDRRLTGPGGATMAYQLVNPLEDNAVVKDLSGASDGSGLIADSIRGGGPAGRTVSVPFDLMVPAGQVLAAGTYIDTVTLSLYKGLTGQDGLRDQAVIPISLVVPPFVSVSVVDTGGVFDPAANQAHLDFGALRQGDARSLDVLVRTNVDYQVSIESMHRGFMAILATGDDSLVPYTLEVDGIPRDLSSGAAPIGSGSGPSATVGNRYGLTFAIGEVGDATSGDYEDNLTVIVTAR